MLKIGYRWLCNLLFFGNKYTVEQAFASRIGHELAHAQFSLAEKRMKKLPIDHSLIDKIIEIHADYFGITITGDEERDHFIRAMEYITKQREEEGRCNNKESETHPSYAKRMEYVREYDFDERLISMLILSTDNSIDNQTVCRYTQEILSELPPVYLRPSLDKANISQQQKL